MAEVVIFHHAQGLTRGVGKFAETLRRAGHTVHVPDLYDGRVFKTLQEGVAFAQETGFDTIIERGQAAAEELPRELVYAGFSLGVLSAQMLSQTRSGAKPRSTDVMALDRLLAAAGTGGVGCRQGARLSCR
jgi:dienelactone hydrolase